MIKELFDLGYLNIEKIIISESNKLNISPLEVMTLIELINCYKRNKKIDKNIIMVNLRQTNYSIDEILYSLLEKNLYEIYLSYEGAKAEEYISLDPLFTKLEELITTPNAIKIESQLEEIIDIVQVKMNKLLSANELEFVKEWVFDKGYNKDKIVEIIASIEAQNKKVTFRSLMVAMENYGKDSSNDELSKLMEKIRA